MNAIREMEHQFFFFFISMANPQSAVIWIHLWTTEGFFHQKSLFAFMCIWMLTAPYIINCKKGLSLAGTHYIKMYFKLAIFFIIILLSAFYLWVAIIFILLGSFRNRLVRFGVGCWSVCFPFWVLTYNQFLEQRSHIITF